MATYLLYATKQEFKNSTGRNAVIASGADEAAARVAAKAAAESIGETTIHDSWAAELLSANDDIAAPIFVQGNVAEPLQRSRGK